MMRTMIRAAVAGAGVLTLALAAVPSVETRTPQLRVRPCPQLSRDGIFSGRAARHHDAPPRAP
jgi:hypothetical protein